MKIAKKIIISIVVIAVYLVLIYLASMLAYGLIHSKEPYIMEEQLARENRTWNIVNIVLFVIGGLMAWGTIKGIIGEKKDDKQEDKK